MGSGGNTGDSGQPSVGDARMVGGHDHDDDNDKELGIDEMDELAGQLVDYISELVLLP